MQLFGSILVLNMFMLLKSQLKLFPGHKQKKIECSVYWRSHIKIQNLLMYFSDCLHRNYVCLGKKVEKDDLKPKTVVLIENVLLRIKCLLSISLENMGSQ